MRIALRNSLAGLVVLALGASAHAQSSERLADSDNQGRPLSLSHNDVPPAGEMRMNDMADTTTSNSNGYLGLSEFFQIREANPNVIQGQWQLQVPLGWSTPSGVGMDNVSLAPSITYGITDDWMVQLGLLPIYLGRGGEEGQGDLRIYTLYRILRESETIPALALVGTMRIPSGDQSSGVDGRFQANVTKTLFSKFRVHLQGFVETDNGGRGRLEYDSSGEHRRHFSWGIGPGFDYQIDEKTLALLNYQNRSSEYYGNRNPNILQLGVSRNICEGQDIQVVFDVNLNGASDNERFGAAVNYSLKWK